MSFAINPSMNHINLPEAYIEALYRSSAEVSLPDARFRGHPCEAFICISKIEKTMNAYVGILDMGLKSVLVYTSEFEADNPADYPEVFLQAEEFVNAMGFTMERVNLDFSPAMREVIIKGFRVMRPPPPPKKQGRYPKIDHSVEYQLPDMPSPVDNSLQLDIQGEELEAELGSLRAEITSARAVIEKLTREKVSAEQSALIEIASLKSVAEQAIDARRKSEEKAVQEIQSLKEQLSTSIPRVEEEERTGLIARLRNEADKAQSLENQLRKDLTELQEKNRRLEGERNEIEKQLSSDTVSLDEKISALTAENESLQTRLSEEQAANSAASDKMTALALFEVSWREGLQREEDLCRDIDTMKLQLEAMESELQSHRDTGNREETLIRKITGLEAAAAEIQTEIDQLRINAFDAGKQAPGLKALEEGKRVIESEYVRLANESREKEIELVDALSAAEAEIQRLSKEIEIQVQVAAMEQAALRAELKRIVMSAGAAPQDSVTVPLESVKSAELSTGELIVKAEAAHAAATVKPDDTAGSQQLPHMASSEDDPDLPVQKDQELLRGLVNELGNFYSEPGYSSTEFSIDPSITSLEYSDPSEIVALFYSSNSVQAVPVGSSIQRCKSFVIGMKKSGRYLTYIIWYLTEGKEVVICTPQQQPADSTECIRILQDAVAYFEIVGFMMEFEELGSSTKSYTTALKKVPALRKAING